MTHRWTIHHFDTIDSTNRWLADEAAKGAPDATVAIADEQSAGRGRLGRTWTAPSGSALLMSVLVRPDASQWPLESWPVLSFAVAEAARRAVVALGASTASLKWPNDLLAQRPDGEERKLAGVLAQAVHGAHPGVVIGIGCNVARPDGLPDDVAARGVWLDEVGVATDPATLADAVLHELDALIPLGPAAVIAAVRASCSTLGRPVRVELPGGEVVGRAAEVRDDGALVLDVDGVEHVVTVGDVVHLRPA